MAGNNLRILFNNVADSATLTATTSATFFPTTNMQQDIKGKVWRSTSAISNVLTLSWSTSQSINCIVLPYTNLSNSATIKVTLFSGINGTGSTLYTSSTVPAISYSLPTWDISYTGVNAYSYGGGSIARVYLPSTVANVQSIQITLVDSTNSQGYLEVARVLAGVYWSPKFNTDFGITIDLIDQSTHSRAQSGNIITDIGPVYKKLSFNLNYMNASDRDYLLQIMRLNGMRKPMYVSLFPIDTDTNKEATYQVYGKLSSNPTITHPMYSIYSSSITIEEV